MKNALLLTALLGTSVLVGCAAAPYQSGFIYSDLSAPVAVSSNAACTKKGTSESINVLGLVGIGDASIETAKKNGDLSAVSSVDYQFTSFLTIFSKTTTTVCGN